jgi:Asp-tRNA(Asn)/Glu-tRNA(Gln) amidotransferase A subunit family amidase
MERALDADTTGALDVDPAGAAPTAETTWIDGPLTLATPDPIARLTAVELAGLLHRRELSAMEALDAVLARAERLVPALNPFSVPLYDRARAAALHADEVLVRGEGGPLTGLPVTAKDSQWLAGVESAVGSLTMRGFVPGETAVALERLENAGAVIFAKTAVPEFCYSGICESPVHGRTSNPWDLTRTPGGSSGGAGAAVASGIGPLSLGGDGGGSIRIPAAFCGVVGFKPTFGAIPRAPCNDAWRTLVAVGPLARTVADARLMFGVLVGSDPRDHFSVDVVAIDQPAPEPAALRAVVSEDFGSFAVDDDVRAAFRRAVAALEAAGVTLVEANPGIGSSIRPWATIAAAEARREEEQTYLNRREELTQRAAHFLEFGGRIAVHEYDMAQGEREHIRHAYREMFERTGASVLITPALGCEAFEHGTNHPLEIGGEPIHPLWMDWAPFLYDANLGGFPALSLPIGFGDDGLPVGLQVQALPGHDGAVLAAAQTIERVVGWRAWPPEPPAL